MIKTFINLISRHFELIFGEEKTIKLDAFCCRKYPTAPGQTVQHAQHSKQSLLAEKSVYTNVFFENLASENIPSKFVQHKSYYEFAIISAGKK